MHSTEKHRTLPGLYREHFRELRRERLFLASAAFFITFSSARVISYFIRHHNGPFRNVYVRGTHIHHLVFGILLLMLVGYLWLLQIGTGENKSSRLWARLTAFFYGTGAALTLDEFALWLNLEDFYRSRQGRESIDAVIIFGAILFVGLFGGSFFRALGRHSVNLVKRWLRM
jgi:hypothetical protein